MENVFVEAVEEVRKAILKRKLKTEINTKRHVSISSHDGGQPDRGFEESLIKLTSLGKNKIKMVDFTTVDKQNLLDLFVNNQKVLITIYEILFASANSMFDH